MTGTPTKIGVSIGVDIVEIERFERIMQRWGDRFLNRCFTLSEVDHARGRPETLAAHFAAKEAASKALGTGMIILAWRDIEVVTLRSGRPELRLHGRAGLIAEHNGWVSVSVSQTHSAGVAVSVVVALTS